MGNPIFIFVSTWTSAGKSRDGHAPTTSSHRAPTGGNIPGTSRGILWGIHRYIPGNPMGKSRGILWDVPGCPGRAWCSLDVPWMFTRGFTRGFTGGPWRCQKLAILSKFRHFIFQVVARGFDLPGTPESPGNPRGIPVQAPPLPPVSGYGVCGRDPPCGAGGARWGPGRGKWGAVGSGRGFPVERGWGVPGEPRGVLLGILWEIPGESYRILWEVPGESYGTLRGVLWGIPGNPMERYREIPGDACLEIFIFFPASTVAVQGGSRGSPGYYTGYAAHPRE